MRGIRDPISPNYAFKRQYQTQVNDSPGAAIHGAYAEGQTQLYSDWDFDSNRTNCQKSPSLKRLHRLAPFIVRILRFPNRTLCKISNSKRSCKDDGSDPTKILFTPIMMNQKSVYFETFFRLL